MYCTVLSCGLLLCSQSAVTRESEHYSLFNMCYSQPDDTPVWLVVLRQNNQQQVSSQQQSNRHTCSRPNPCHPNMSAIIHIVRVHQTHLHRILGQCMVRNHYIAHHAEQTSCSVLAGMYIVQYTPAHLAACQRVRQRAACQHTCAPGSTCTCVHTWRYISSPADPAAHARLLDAATSSRPDIPSRRTLQQPGNHHLMCLLHVRCHGHHIHRHCHHHRSSRHAALRTCTGTLVPGLRIMMAHIHSCNALDRTSFAHALSLGFSWWPPPCCATVCPGGRRLL
jgi:hypothetical protein